MKILLFFTVFTCVSSLVMAQFSGTMKNVMSGKERVYQVYNDGENYRYEFTEDGMAGIVIVKPSKNETSILLSDKKYVHHTTCDDMMSRMNDPVQAVALYQQQGTVKDEGEEKVEDYTCKKTSISQGGTRVFTVWYAEKLKFPMKIENHLTPDTHMELMGIVSWDVVESYFEVPDGYTEVDDQMRPIIPEPPPPETWVSKAVTLPFELVLKRGEKISMDIPAAGHYKIKVRNEGDTPTKYIYHLYENGEKLTWDKVGNDDRRTHRIYMDEKRTFTYAWEAGWQLIVEGYEGEVSMEIFAE